MVFGQRFNTRIHIEQFFVNAQWRRHAIEVFKLEPQEEYLLIKAKADLADLGVSAVRVELFASGLNGNPPERLEMMQTRDPSGDFRGMIYSATLFTNRPATDYTARLVPYFDGFSVPLEAGHILWER